MTLMPARKSRILLILLTLLSVALIAVACGDDDDDDGGDNGGSTTSTPKKGGEITIVYPEPESFDPHYSAFAQDIGVQRMVWRGLYKLNVQNVAEPEMAASLPTVSSDGKTYTVKLKSGLKWSDDAPLLAKDFVAGIQRTCDPDNAGLYKDTIGNIVGCDEFYDAADKTADEKSEAARRRRCESLDDTTIEFRLENAQPTFTLILSLWMTFPIAHRTS